MKVDVISSYEVHNDQMEQRMRKYEISKSSFGWDPFEELPVLVVTLDTQTHSQHKAGHAGDEPGEKGVEREGAHQCAVD